LVGDATSDDSNYMGVAGADVGVLTMDGRGGCGYGWWLW
jgi:hypothetical protein